MTVPLRKDQPEELTTADLARGKRPARVEGLRPLDALSGAEPEQQQEPTDATALETAQTHGADDAVAMTQLFPNHELQDFRSRWDNIQTAFVDEPRRAVEQADSLVASAIKRLAEVFAEERAGLEKQWDRGDHVSTEDLRVALTRYRSFFHRLLAI
jgi:hypothetical protein